MASQSRPILYWNCGSGIVRKLVFIKHYLDTLKPSLFFVAESEILNDRDLSCFNHPGYHLECSKTLESRSKARIICWHNPDFRRCPDLEENFNELMVFTNGLLHVTGIYRPFKLFEGETTNGNFNRLITNLTNISGRVTSHIVVGDFNVDMSRDENNMLRICLDKWSDDYVMDQMVNEITRSRLVNGTAQASILDLVYSNCRGTSVKCYFENSSDHVVVEINLEGLNQLPKVKKTINYYDWRGYSKENICREFMHHFRGFNVRLRDVNLINE